MSPFDLEISNMTEEFLDTFGFYVFVNGIKIKAIFNDEEYEDEAGYRNDISIEIPINSLVFFKEGGKVLVNEDRYLIRHIPKPSTEDPFLKIGLKRA